MIGLKKFRLVGLAVATGLAGLLLASCASPQPGPEVQYSPGQSSRSLPAPVTDEPPSAAGQTDTAILAGGCFWAVQGVYQHVKGVTQALSGYAGGSAKDADYEVVGTGATGHAESVKITYDPSQISYGQLLRIFFSVAHDPTELNRQGPDTGTQYRSAIFPQNDAQKRVADSYIAQLTAAKSFDKPIVTRLENAAFYPAEGHHQDFLASNPNDPYIVTNDLPKLADLKRLFPEFYRDQPVLVLAASPR